MTELTDDMRARLVCLKPEAVAISDLILDPANARKHPEKNIQSIRESLAEFGQRKSVVVRRSTMTIEAGNGTVEAARQLGWTHVAAVLLDDDEITAVRYAITDNRTGELAEWDHETLGKLVASIDLDDYEPALPGWDPAELDELLTNVGLAPEPPEAPEPTEPPADPVSKLGEIYQLGPHRLMCGDCREPETWNALVGDERVNVVFTSPPYASQRKYDESSGFRPIPPDDYVDWWEPLQALVAQYLADDGSFFVNIKEHCDDGERSLYVKDLTIAHVRRWGWRFVDELCWKHHGYPGEVFDRFRNAWEPIFHFSKAKRAKIRPGNVSYESDSVMVYNSSRREAMSHDGNHKGGAIRATGLANPRNVLEISNGASTSIKGHAATFPVGLPEFFIKAFSDDGDVIVDTFIGSGSTLLAAARQGRRCYGMEISPAYCDVIRARWGDYAKAAGIDPGPDAL